MDNLKKHLKDAKLNLIKLAHPGYEITGICCDKKDIAPCFDKDFIIDPMKDYKLPVYLILKKIGTEELKFINYHVYSGCAIGLMLVSQSLEDISNYQEQTKEMKLNKDERKDYRSSR